MNLNQSFYGLLLFIFLMIPPVADFMESVMVIHMHMQMPMLVIAGFLMARSLQSRFPVFFEKWNTDGIPGILLFVFIMIYWMLPRTMDEALTVPAVEAFKFISLPFLAGIPLRDSWRKISPSLKNGLIIGFAFLFLGLGWLYIASPVQLCNNYLLIEQITLGWAFVATAICFVIFLAYTYFVDPEQYE
jgi:hypothetical protein